MEDLIKWFCTKQYITSVCVCVYTYMYIYSYIYIKAFKDEQRLIELNSGYFLLINLRKQEIMYQNVFILPNNLYKQRLSDCERIIIFVEF